MKVKIRLFFFFILSVSPLPAQSPCYFEHYSAVNGLPQHTVMDILQDKKGFMWFATWDGLCKFDGYEFTTYKTVPGDIYSMKTNRIDNIYEDKYGYLWFQSYDGEAHRFDPHTETFKGVQSVPGYDRFSFSSSKIRLFPSGKVWLLSEETGCICITDSLMNTEIYNDNNKRILGKNVHEVFEDQSYNSWLLCDNGLYLIPAGETDPLPFFIENNNTPYSPSFYSALELEEEILFGSGKGRVRRYNKKKKAFDLLETAIQSNIIGIKKLQDGLLAFISSEDGFVLYNTGNKSFKYINSSTLPAMKSNRIFSVYADKDANLWMEQDCPGVAKYDTQKDRFDHFQVNMEDINNYVFPPNFFIFEDLNGRLWVHPRGGGFSEYDREKNKLIAFYNDPTDQRSKFSNIFHSAYPDRQGNLWFCSRSYGLYKAVFDKKEFKTFTFEPNTHSSIANEVRTVFEDNRQNLWISTKDGKLRILDKNRNFLGYFSEKGTITDKALPNSVVYCMMQDKLNNIWIGTKGNGVFKAQPTDSTYRSFHITRYKNNPNDSYSLNDNNIYSIFQDSKGRIWIGTYGGGLNLLQEDSGKIRFINHRNHLKNYPIETGNRIRFITEDKHGNINVGTTFGLLLFKSDFSDPENIRYRHYSGQQDDIESLGANDVHYIYHTKKGEMFIGTFGGGLNKVIEFDREGFPLKFKSYMTKDGLPSDIVLSMVEDENEKLWIATENSLAKFDPEKETIQMFGDIKRFMLVNRFSEASVCRSRSNEIIFGYMKGIVSFFPQNTHPSDFNPYISLEKLRIFNKEIKPGKDSPLKTSLDETKSLVLDHNRNFFSIRYAALDLVDPGNISYAYKLEGFDDDWNYVHQQRIANYTNLPKGKYVFRVKSTNSEGIWMDNERRLPIEIKPSFGETPWAYLLYIVLFIALITLTIRILLIIYRLKDKVKLEHSLSEMKLRFFTNISHEIRTPLTMITAPVDYLLKDEKTPSEIKKHLQLISGNTNRLLRMVNQILDFRKVQYHRLKVEETEWAPFAEKIYNNFKYPAETQRIDFRFINDAGDQTLWIDRDCVEKIIFNLLSNAFKYTPEEKGISVRVGKNEKNIFISIADEGTGITKERLPKLFNRFVSFNEDSGKPSTGIGLSMVKELADKHHAKITAESEPGKGSCFTISFLYGHEHFDKEADILSPDRSDPSASPSEKEKETDLKHETEEQPSILVVEDDPDLRTFLTTILEPDYSITEASDGKEGLEKALASSPDFIISDIMMPHMDGIQLLQQLKENFNTSHIPVVLLTAKSTAENQLEGLDYGADDYIIKPFDVAYVKTRIENLLKQRQRLQAYYRSDQIGLRSTNHPGTNLQDERFIKQVTNEIEKNIDNSEYTIDILVTSLGMSRTVFFKKIKSLTGLPPVEFIRDFKLKRAAQLIMTGEFSVKETAFMIGMSDVKYFSKCFKAKFGMNPGEYKNKLN